MTKYVHRPTPVDAVRWDGDLADVRDFVTGDTDAHRDAVSDVLWVTQQYRGTTNVFPVALRHFLVRDAKSGLLFGVSAHAFMETYELDKAEADLVAV